MIKLEMIAVKSSHGVVLDGDEFLLSIREYSDGRFRVVEGWDHVHAADTYGEALAWVNQFDKPEREELDEIDAARFVDA